MLQGILTRLRSPRITQDHLDPPGSPQFPPGTHRTLQDLRDPFLLLQDVEVLAEVGRHVPGPEVLRVVDVHPVKVALLAAWRARHHPLVVSCTHGCLTLAGPLSLRPGETDRHTDVSVKLGNFFTLTELKQNQTVSLSLQQKHRRPDVKPVHWLVTHSTQFSGVVEVGGGGGDLVHIAC